MHLFEGESRLSKSAATINMSDYNVIKYSRRRDIAILRKILESWYEEYPDCGKLDLRNRLMKQENFDAALFELYIFKLFSNLGYELTLHPNLSNNNNHPDFVAISERQILFVEAKVCFDTTEKEKAAKKRKATVLDSIDSIVDGRFGLAIERNEVRGAQPSAKNLKKYILNRFDVLDQRITPKLKPYDLTTSEKFEYEDDGISMSGKVFAYSVVNKENPVVGIDASNNGYGINYSEKIRDAIKSKAKKYGNLDNPFIICLNLPEAFINDNDIISALFWRTEFRLLINMARDVVKTENAKIADGIFYDNASHCENVSAVLILQMKKETIGCPKYWLVLNSRAKHKLDQWSFPLGSIQIRNDKISIEEEKTPINEVLGIPKQWIESI